MLIRLLYLKDNSCGKVEKNEKVSGVRNGGNTEEQQPANQTRLKILIEGNDGCEIEGERRKLEVFTPPSSSLTLCHALSSLCGIFTISSLFFFPCLNSMDLSRFM